VLVAPDAIKAFHVDKLPTIYVIDAEGRIVARQETETIRATIARLVKD
jgi:tartrate dehydratase beta subunit/fumarate hydratase class I family protein